MRRSQSDLILQKSPHSEDLKSQIGLEKKQNNYRHICFTLKPTVTAGRILPLIAVVANDSTLE